MLKIINHGNLIRLQIYDVWESSLHTVYNNWYITHALIGRELCVIRVQMHRWHHKIAQFSNLKAIVLWICGEQCGHVEARISKDFNTNFFYLSSFHHSSMLLFARVCWFLCDVSYSTWTVSHQTVRHIQHVRGNKKWLDFLINIMARVVSFAAVISVVMQAARETSARVDRLSFLFLYCQCLHTVHVYTMM